MSAAVCKNRFIRCLAISFFVIPACSASGHSYLGASLAASFAQTGNNSPQIAYFSGATITDAYPLSHNRSSAALLGVNGGYEFTAADRRPAVALGLGVYSNLANYNFDGHLVETAAGDASSTLYHYRYHVNTARVMAEIQMTWVLASFSPFINAGVGAAWNRMSDYDETAITSSGYPALPGFQSHTNTRVAWQAGLGLSRTFHFASDKTGFSEDRVSLGYRFVNSGKASFGGRNAAYPYALDTGSLKTNEVYLGYTHLF